MGVEAPTWSRQRRICPWNPRYWGPCAGLLRAEAILGLEGGAVLGASMWEASLSLGWDREISGQAQEGAVCLPRGVRVRSEWRQGTQNKKKGDQGSYFLLHTYCVPALHTLHVL